MPVYTEKKASVVAINFEVNSGAGSFVDIVKQQPDETNSQTSDTELRPLMKHNDPLRALPETSPPRDTNCHLYNSTENFRDGVNEMIGEETQMAQNTAYMMSYTSKFN